jgi:hypothetical protein
MRQHLTPLLLALTLLGCTDVGTNTEVPPLVTAKQHTLSDCYLVVCTSDQYIIYYTDDSYREVDKATFDTTLIGDPKH